MVASSAHAQVPLTNPVVRSRLRAPAAGWQGCGLPKLVRRVGAEPTTQSATTAVWLLRIRFDAPDAPPLRGDVLTGRRAVRIHREVLLAVGFAGEQLGVGLSTVAEDDADGVGVGNQPSAAVRRTPENRCVCVMWSMTGSLIAQTLDARAVRRFRLPPEAASNLHLRGSKCPQSAMLPHSRTWSTRVAQET